MSEIKDKTKEIRKYILNGTNLIFEGIEFIIDYDGVRRDSEKESILINNKLEQMKEFCLGKELKGNILNLPRKVWTDSYYYEQNEPAFGVIPFYIDGKSGTDCPDGFTIEYSNYLLRTVKNDNLCLLVITPHNLNAFFSLID